MDYVDRFLYIEPSLHPWDETYLIVVNEHISVSLDSVCEDFFEYFCIDIHKGNWSEVLFLCWIFVWFRYVSNSYTRSRDRPGRTQQTRIFCGKTLLLTSSGARVQASNPKTKAKPLPS